jgi:hypothetical protein
MGSPSALRRKEGQKPKDVCGLSLTERSYYQEQVPSPQNR